MTTIMLAGGDLGLEKMLVRCDLSQASAPIEVDYHNGDGCGFEGTQYQCADARHRTSGLIAIGKRLAAQACEVSADKFACEAVEV